MNFTKIAPAAAALGLIATLAGCTAFAPPSFNMSGRPAADAATQAACRARTEEAYNRRNRGSMADAGSVRDTPQSGLAERSPTRALSNQFSYEQDYRDCLRGASPAQEPAALPATPPGAPPATPATAKPVGAKPAVAPLAVPPGKNLSNPPGMDVKS